MTSSWTERIRRAAPWVMPPLIFCAVLLVYWPALRGAQIWDDPAHITQPELQGFSGLWRIWTEIGATQEFYPVLHSAFWIEHKLWGDNTLGYHLTNVVLHAGSCCLLALFLLRLWAPRDGSVDDPMEVRARVVPAGFEWFAALLFALHPVCVESVAWITEQKNTLSLFLCLVSAVAYLDFSNSRRRSSYWAALVFYFLTLAAKPSTIALPAAMLVLVWWRQGRVTWRRDVLPTIPLFAIALAAGVVTVWVEGHVVGAANAGFDWTATERLLLAGRVIWFYLGKLAWPAELIFYYEHWDVAAVAAGWWPYLVVSIALTCALWAIRRRTRGPLAAWLLFVGTLFPVLGFFNVYGFTFSQVADHFQYVPCMVFLAAFSGFVGVALSRVPRRASAGGVLAMLSALTILGVRSHTLSAQYVDDETLFKSVTARNPESWMAHHMTGLALSKAPGRESEAIASFRRAIEINPGFPDSHLALGVELIKNPATRSEALEEYARALELRPFYAEAHNALGVELAKSPERRLEAIEHFRKALEFRPRLVSAHLNLANALSKDPATLPEAMGHFEAVLRIDPDYPRGHNDYALALSRVPGRTDEAISQFKTALRLAPGFAEAHCNLADLLAESPSGAADAISQYELALKYEPRSAKAHYGLANVLATRAGRPEEAIAHYESAIEVAPGFAEAHANLANVLAHIPGRAGDAIAQYDEALRIDPKLSWVHFNIAMLLAQLPEGIDEAISHYRDALRLKPDYTDAMNGLAILFAQQGRFDEARTQWQHALQVDPAYETARQNLRLLEQMQSKRR